MADQKIPYEYHTDFGQAAELEQIAQLMERQRLLNRQGMQGQMVSGHFVRMSPMQGLADLFAAYQGGKARSEAAKIREGATSRMAADERGQIGKIAQMMTGSLEPIGPPTPQGEMGLQGNMPNPAQAAQLALASQFPRVRDMGKELGQRASSTFSTAYKDSTPASQAVALQQGGNPVALAPKPDPRFSGVQNLAPPGSEPILGVVEEGTNRPIFAPRATRVEQNVNQGRFEDQALARRDEHLLKMRPEALKYSETQRSLLEAYKLLKSGAMNTGALASQVTEIQALAKFFNTEVPPNVPATQFFANTLLPQLTQTLKSVNPVGASSNRELELALKLAPSADRDPRALDAMLRHAMRAMYIAHADYDNQVKAYAELLAKKGYDPSYAETIRVPGGLQGMDEATYRALLVDPIDPTFRGGGPKAGDQLSPTEDAAIRRYLPGSGQ